MEILNLLTQEQQDKIQIKNYKKGEIIFRESQTCEYVSFVISGVVSINSFTLSGNQIIYNTVVENQLFGNNLLFSDEPKYLGNIVCKTDVKVVNISIENMFYLLQNNKAFLNEYLKEQSNTAKMLNLKMKIMSFNSASERLLYLLEINDNKIKVNSVSDIANKLFLTREATSRTITKLIKENRIRRTNAIIEII